MTTCLKCNEEIITETFINISNDRNYHLEHFVCIVCNEQLGGKTYFEENNEFYCDTHYHNKFSETCSNCLNSIKGEYVIFNDKPYHSNCLVCVECNTQFVDGKIISFVR